MIMLEHDEMQLLFSSGFEALQRPHNYKKGERQTVFPIKSLKQIISVTQWLYHNSSINYVLGFALGINLGLRANELLSLKVKDVLWEDGSVKYIEDDEDTSDVIEVFQSKTKKYRLVFLNTACKDALEWYFSQPECSSFKYSPNEYLFPSREGGHIKVDTFRKVLKRAASASGVRQNIGTHTMRKTWGWWQYKYNCKGNDMDITMLQRAFGHSSSEITLRYLGITDEEDKALYHGMNINIVKESELPDNSLLCTGDLYM